MKASSNSPAASQIADGIVGAIGNTPLVRMRRFAAPASVDLWGKLESTNPGGSAKDRPAARMIAEALRNGDVGPSTTVIESSSGNMAIGLAQVCRFHHLRLICVLDSKSNPTTVRTLRALGADVRVVTEPDPVSGDLLTARLHLVARLAEQIPDTFWTDQYSNRANPAAHAEGTAREIDEALNGELDYLFVASGTAGTLRGCAEYLSERGRETRLIAVDACGSALFGGDAGTRLLPGHGAGVESRHSKAAAYDELVRVSDLDCVIGCRRLVDREAIFAGASSGAVAMAFDRMLPSIEPGSRCAIILPDGGTRYLDTVYDDEWVASELGCASDELARAVRGEGQHDRNRASLSPMGEVGGSGPLRVAIVGLGPKGLFALERLLDRAARVGLPREIQVDAYEPHAVPGAGPVYEPTQPDFLRMNFEADRIDAWPEGSQAVPEDLQLSFVAWRSRNPDLGDDAYPPRAYVGRYLAECLQAVSREPPPGVSVEIHQSRVTAVRQGESWSVQCGDTSRDYDEVIIATGHASDWTGALRHGWEHAARLVDAVFPVDQKLTTEAVPPGSRVAARGFALTFIDMALALTEGRGGVFESEGDRLRYRPSGAEPAVIFPFSRTGQPMLAKPELAAAKESAEWERAAAEAEASLLRAPPPDPVGSTLVGVVDQLASNPDNPAAGHDAARGAAWRAIYGAVVERFGGHGLSPEEWPAFHALAAEMERLAFGPPPLNVASIAALVDAGIVDTTHARGGLLETADGRTQLSSSVGTAAVDVVVDAVLAPPGIVGVDDPLVAGLVAAGHARVAPGQRGIEVSPDATCVAADGSSARGLAACGRPTEDSVIGNDTLSRTLHPQLDRWADRVVRGR